VIKKELKNLRKKFLNREYLLVFLIMFSTGFASLLYEIVLISYITLIIGVTEYSTSIVIASFLFGLAIGAFIGGVITRKKFNHKKILITIEFLIALLGMSLLFILSFLLYKINLGAVNVYLLFLILFLILQLPAIFMGMEIPIAVKILNKNTAYDTGFAYSADTLGSVLGAFFGGITIIPLLGFQGAMFFGAILNISTGIMAFFIKTKIKIRYPIMIFIICLSFIGVLAYYSNALSRMNLELLKPVSSRKIIYEEVTPFQEIIVRHDPYLGNALFLDGRLQVTEKDSFNYHEHLVMPAFAIHPNPKKVLLIGGGDGGALYQIEKFDVEEIDFVDIDRRVIEIAKKYLKGVHRNSFDDERVNIVIADGRKYLEGKKEEYDIIIIDLPDPMLLKLSPLYTKEFYILVKNALKKDGVMVTQAGSSYKFTESFVAIYKTVSSVFEKTGYYHTFLGYGGEVSYVIGSKYYDIYRPTNREKINGKWYKSSQHNKIFDFPEFLEEYFKNNSIEISTDKKPTVYYYTQPKYYFNKVSD